MSFKRVEAKPQHQFFKRDLEKLLRKYAGKLPAAELLAISAQTCGMIAALQDQRTMTPKEAMEIIIENIKNGNQLIAASSFNNIAGNA